MATPVEIGKLRAQLSSGKDVQVDATQFTPEQLASLGSTTVTSPKSGKLKIVNHGHLSDADKRRAMPADPVRTDGKVSPLQSEPKVTWVKPPA